MVHSATPYETGVLSILIALLIPFMAPGPQISLSGLQFDASQTAKLSAAGGTLLSKVRSQSTGFSPIKRSYVLRA
jgi:hypothetical protein